MKPVSAPDAFKPGRVVNQSCLEDASGRDGPNNYERLGCVLYPGDAANQAVLVNQTEYVKIAGNQSDLNKVYLGNFDGRQYSVLGPSQIPPSLDFTATSYGTHTMCSMVTLQCGAESAYGARDEPESFFNFICNNTVAGLNVTGSFDNLGKTSESYYESGKNASSDRDKSPILLTENVNTFTTSNYGFGFQYFYDSNKTRQVQGVSGGLGSSLGEHANQYFWAMAFSSTILMNIDESQTNQNPWSSLNMVASQQGGAEGIMSCVTNISEIVSAQFPSQTNFGAFRALTRQFRSW